MHKSLINKFNSFEKDEQLFKLKIDNILIWDYVRTKVFFEIRVQQSKLKITKKGLKQKPFDSLYRVLKQIVFLIFHFNYFRIKTKKEILVLGHPRRQKIDRFYIDIYTEQLTNKLKDEYSLFLLELPFELSHFRPINMPEVKYLDLLEIGQIFHRSTFKLGENDLKKLIYIEEKIYELFGSIVNLKKIVLRFVSNYKYSNKRIKKILSCIEPKLIIVVDGYNLTKKHFIELANKKNIPTIELQHGAIGAEHIAYNYSIGVNPISFPKYFFAWGEYWHKNTKFPLDTKIFNTGFPFMEFRHNNDELHNQKDTNILVSSQWTIGFELMKFIIDFALKAPKYRFIVKLHPKEYNVINEYKALTILENILYVTDELSIYTLFERCQTHIGVYSTTLVEGIAYNLKTLIIPLDGFEMYSDLIEKQQFFKVETFEIFIDVMENKRVSYSKNEFWVEDALDNICINIDSILNSNL